MNEQPQHTWESCTADTEDLFATECRQMQHVSSAGNTGELSLLGSWHSTAGACHGLASSLPLGLWDWYMAVVTAFCEAFCEASACNMCTDISHAEPRS